MKKLTAYVILAINIDGRKDVLSIEIGENESAKYWFGAFKDSWQQLSNKSNFQRCIIHQVRNTLKYVSAKDRKEFASDLKKIYTVPNEEIAATIRDEVEEKWNKKIRTR